MNKDIELDYEEHSFKDVAMIVWAINPCMSRDFRDPECLRSYMTSMAFSFFRDGLTTSFATGGFELTGYRINDKMIIRASVSAHLVKSFMERSAQSVRDMMKNAKFEADRLESSFTIPAFHAEDKIK